MNQDLAGLARRHGGVVVRSVALTVVPHHVLDHALVRGHLVRVLPCVYVLPDRLEDLAVRHRAALAYAGRSAALSHVSALRVWWPAVPLPVASDVHLVVPPTRRLRAVTGIAVHRRATLAQPHVVLRGGVPVTRFERALVDSWPLLPVAHRRGPVIGAVADRRTTAQRIAEELVRVPNLRGRRDLVDLLGQLAAGCHSELEVWGCREVFTGPGFEHLEWQAPVRLRRRTIYLDAFDREARVAFELDGAAWHTSPVDRARDLRRDAALAALGILVVRYTYERLHAEPMAVRAEARSILAVHRRRRGA